MIGRLVSLLLALLWLTGAAGIFVAHGWLIDHTLQDGDLRR